MRSFAVSLYVLALLNVVLSAPTPAVRLPYACLLNHSQPFRNLNPTPCAVMIATACVRLPKLA